MVPAFTLSLPAHVLFGPGVRNQLGAQARSLGKSALLVTGETAMARSGRLEEISGMLNDASVDHERVAVSGEPSPAAVDSIVAAHRGKDIDLVVAVGGGSVLDTGKAVAAMVTVDGGVEQYLEKVGTQSHPGTTLPLIALPTTAGTGSEATKNAVLSRVGADGFKASLRHDNFVPRCAIVDPELHLSCPPDVTAACGMDALTQLLEAYVSTKATPFTDALAWSGLESAAQSLMRAAGDTGGTDIDARTGMAYASLLSGVVLAHAGLGVVHGLASVLGAAVPIPHGVACGTVLAAATSVTIEHLLNDKDANAPLLAKYGRVGRLLSGYDGGSDIFACGKLAAVLESWVSRLGLSPLGAYGIGDQDVDALAQKAGNKNNPADLTGDKRAEILRRRLG
ncbi:MAG: iron-containing alcohol dehydrogenase [Chitinivibrionales bacterium]|nr:iron-containing alcohol dehydrogenase [Chitinivibrionales bacterium]